MRSIMLAARDLVRTYENPDTRRRVRAVNGVSLEVPEGGALGILGASGAGKSSLTRLLLGLETPDRGRIVLDGTDLVHGPSQRIRDARRRMQAVFQDPRSSLNPHLRIGTIISEPLLAQGGDDKAARQRRIVEVLRLVGLPESFVHRRPERLSGGERQRVAIARAIATSPDLLILDEPVSSLDGPVRSQILGLLAHLKAQLGLTIVIVSHDVRSMRRLAESVMVMYAGRCVEEGPTEKVLENPLHPYTRALLAAVPRVGNETHSMLDPTTPSESGCACSTWCPLADHRCREQPELRHREDQHGVACWVSWEASSSHHDPECGAS